MPLSNSRLVHALGVSQIISWGAIYYAITVLAKPMAVGLSVSETLIFGGFSLAILVGGLTAMPVARFTERYGGRVTMALGSVIGAATMIMVAMAEGPLLYLAAFALMGICHRLTLYDAAFATLVEVWGTEARRPISIITLYGGLASTVFWPLAHVLNDQFGWRMTWIVFAVLLLVVCLPMHLLLLPRFSPSERRGTGEASAEARPLIAPHERWIAVSLLAAALAFNALVFTALSAHLIPIFVLLGLPLALAVGIASTKGIVQTLGRLWEILFASDLSPFTLSLVALGALPLAFAALALLGVNSVGAVVFCVLYGLSNGLVTIVRGAMPLVLFGRQGYASVLALITMPGLLVMAAAPVSLAGLITWIGPVATMALLFAAACLSLVAVGGLAFLYAHRLRR